MGEPNRERLPSVELWAFLQHGSGTIPVTVLIAGETSVAGLTAATMRAITDQHPHHADKPIVALRYNVQAQTRVPE